MRGRYRIVGRCAARSPPCSARVEVRRLPLDFASRGVAPRLRRYAIGRCCAAVLVPVPVKSFRSDAAAAAARACSARRRRQQQPAGARSETCAAARLRRDARTFGRRRRVPHSLSYALSLCKAVPFKAPQTFESAHQKKKVTNTKKKSNIGVRTTT